MNFNLKYLIKKIVPKKVTKTISDTFQYYSFKGNYKNFEEIKINLTKYDSKKVIERVTNAFKNSKNNSFLIDRDGELINTKNQTLQLLSIMRDLLNKHKLNCVVDFGGSLANFYRNNMNYLKMYNIKWIVIDNKNICILGKKLIKDNNIVFLENLKKTKRYLKLRRLKQNYFLLGSSIQYLKNFEEILKEILDLNVEVIIIDRQPVLRSKSTKYSIQKTPPWAGNLNYAVKLYNSRSLINLFNKYNYYLDKIFNAFGNKFLDGDYKSYIFKKK